MKKNIKLIYDTCRKLVRDAENQVNENKPIDQSILNSLTAAFSDIIEFEKIYLIQCQDRFYGSILMDLDINIDFKQRGAVDLKIKTSPMQLTINPMFCSDYNFSEFTGMIINEITKLVWLHPATFGELNKDKDPKKHADLERASSAASTSIVKRDIRLVMNGTNTYSNNSNGCRIPQDVETTNGINTEFNINAGEGQSIEYYYHILSRFNKKNNQNNNNTNSNSNGVATKNNSDGEPIHNWEDCDESEVKEQIISMVSNVYNSLSEEAKGDLPSSVLSQIKKLMAPPEINWKQILRKMVGSVPVPYRKTRKRLNRRQPTRSDLCGKLPKRTVNIVCCFDTSGSMSDKDLEYCMNEVFNIVKSYEGYKVTIIETDAEIQAVYQARNLSELQTKMRGRGGTSFIPTINFINGEAPYNDPKKYPLAGHFRDALMIYFTDGFGDYEIPKPKTYRNLWVVLKDEKNLSLKNPYGEVKSLMGDSDYRKMKGI